MTTRDMESTTRDMEIPVKSIQKGGNLLTFQIRGVPVQFVNAIRRTLLNETPTVEITDVHILENDTLMPHEVLRHRTEMLPVNVHPAQEDVIRDTKLTLRMVAEENRIVTTDDFANNILMRDIDLGTPIFFLKLKKDEKIHIQGRLTLNPRGTQVCQATYSYHIDEERMKMDAEKYEDKETFLNFYKQRSYHVNEKGRPDWFDVTIESIGVIPAVELLKMTMKNIKTRIVEWTKRAKESIIREAEKNVYHVISEEGHTVGALVQFLAYEICEFASYDVPHPLKNEMKFRFMSDKAPEDILSLLEKKVVEMCDATISGIDK
jgi:DNA-directed RNA polymerase subunit L